MVDVVVLNFIANVKAQKPSKKKLLCFIFVKKGILSSGHKNLEHIPKQQH